MAVPYRYQYGIRFPDSGLILTYEEEGEARRAGRENPGVVMLRRKILFGDWEDEVGEGWRWERKDEWRKARAF
jgi:hypothetical protein